MFVLYGDVLFMCVLMLQCFVDVVCEGCYGILIVMFDDLIGYGCIVCDVFGFVMCIVEQKDVLLEELKIVEINIGIIVMLMVQLLMWFGVLKNENVQGEYYLIDVVEFVIEVGFEVVMLQFDEEWEMFGVNSKV